MHSSYERLTESKPSSHTTVQTFYPDMSFEAFKTSIEEVKKEIDKFIKIAADSKLEADLSHQVTTGLYSVIISQREKYPAYSARYDLLKQERIAQHQKDIADAECVKRWDILNVSASILCCIPSYTLTCCHLCSCLERFQDVVCCYIPPYECGELPPGCIESNPTRTTFGFFFRPINNIIVKTHDYKEKNTLIDELKRQGPAIQSML